MNQEQQAREAAVKYMNETGNNCPTCFIAGWNARPGLVWVKASDRLPEIDKLVCMRGDGGGCYHYETADRSMLIQRLKDDEGVDHKYNPEWLSQQEIDFQHNQLENLGRQIGFLKAISWLQSRMGK